jgi:hypothetical protein
VAKNEPQAPTIYHYTNKSGYNAIKATPEWCFKASQPVARPFGAYFTTLGPSTPKLARRIRIPKRKITYVFCFSDIGDLIPLRGDRGGFIFYSKDDYTVSPDRQGFFGPREDWQ